MIGYTGALCSVCQPGYYDSNVGTLRECRPCGSTQPWVPVVMFVCLLIVTAIFVKLNVDEVILQLTVPLNIALAYVQLVAFLRLVQLWWPASSRAALNILALAVLNIEDITQTSCFISFDTQYWTTLAVPFAFATVLALTGAIYIALHHTHHADILVDEGRNRRWVAVGLRLFASLGVRDWTSCIILLTQVMLSFLSFAYMFLSWQSLLLFDCIPLAGSDGTYVRDFVQLQCHSPEWYRKVIATIGGIVLYAVGIPLVFHFCYYE